MPDKLNIEDFLDSIEVSAFPEHGHYKDGQIGKRVEAYDESFPDLFDTDIIIVGCNEERGNGITKKSNDSVNAIRSEFYRLFYWHTDVKIADIGNITPGATLNDTYAALKTVIKEVTAINKTIVILGGSHDLTLSQYYASADNK